MYVLEKGGVASSALHSDNQITMRKMSEGGSPRHYPEIKKNHSKDSRLKKA